MHLAVLASTSLERVGGAFPLDVDQIPLDVDKYFLRCFGGEFDQFGVQTYRTNLVPCFSAGGTAGVRVSSDTCGSACGWALTRVGQLACG